jgi:hypothetical protein
VVNKLAVILAPLADQPATKSPQPTGREDRAA